MATIEEELETTTKKILELAGFAVEVKANSQKDLVGVEISTGNVGLLIGRHGQNLKALERILQVIFYQELKKEKTILVDIEGFRKDRAKKIEEMANSAILQVLETSQPKTLAGLSAAERKTVHLKVSKNQRLASESSGKGIDRILIIKPRS